MGPYHHAKKQQQKLHACTCTHTHTQSPPPPPPPPATHTHSNNKTQQQKQNKKQSDHTEHRRRSQVHYDPGRSQASSAWDGPALWHLHLQSGSNLNQKSDITISPSVPSVDPDTYKSLTFRVFKLSEWCQMACNGITTITIYFINPSGKLKLSFNHTTMKISQ